MCFNAVTRYQNELIPGYQSDNGHSEFSEYFIPDLNHPSDSWNVNIYSTIGHSFLVAMTNDTCVKFSMAPQAYKVVSTHTH